MKTSSLHLNSLGHVKGNKGEKYNKFIKKLKGQASSEHEETIFHEASDETMTGSGLHAQYSKSTPKFVCWDNPNELVELPVGKQNSGHTGVDNEILSILKELSERRTIINSGRSRFFQHFKDGKRFVEETGPIFNALEDPK